METSTFEPEKNRAIPLLIVKKPTKKLSTADYYGESNFKEWNIMQIIKDRVDRESEVLA